MRSANHGAKAASMASSCAEGTCRISASIARRCPTIIIDLLSSAGRMVRSASSPVPVPIADNEISTRVPRTNERRPDARYNTNTIVSNDAESWYDR